MPSRPIDPDDREQLITRPQPGDDDPVCLTRFQMQKVACIIDAALVGHELWRDHAIAAVDLLYTAAAEAGRAGGVRPSAAERWHRDLEHLPWPPSGPPKPQADGTTAEKE